MNKIFGDLPRELLVLSVFLLAIALALTYVSWDALIEMERMWATKEEYGYAYMIPIISIYFIWQARYETLSSRFHIDAGGALLLLLGLFVILLGNLSATYSLTQYGFVLSIIATFWLFLGWRSFIKIVGPLLLLLLIIPLPGFLFNNLSSQLQLISSQLGVWVIRLFDISVYLEGNVIDLGVYQLQVVEACSGLRYLFPLFSLAMVCAFIFKAELWKRIVLVLSSLPITVIMNSFRIGMIGVLVEYGGIEQAEGFLHDFEGWIIFMACTALLVAEMWLLLKIGNSRLSLLDAFAIDVVEPPESPYRNVNFSTTNYAATTVVVLVLIAAISIIHGQEQYSPDRKSFASFDLEIDGWVGKPDTLEDNVLDALRLDDYFIGDFVNEDREVVNLYMAYYAEQRAGEAAHSPKSCIPGGGWRIKSHTQVDVAVGDDKFPVNRLMIRKGDYAQLVYYWFQQRDRIITNEYLVKWYLFWDALTRGRTDGALVRVTTNISPGEDGVEAEQHLLSLIRSVHPALPEYIPE